MNLKVRNFGIRVGATNVVLVRRTDAQHHDLHPADRVIIKSGRRSVIAVIDILDHHNEPKRSELLAYGEVGLFREVTEALKVRKGAVVTVEPEEKPESLKLIKRKVEGKELREPEMKRIVEDIAGGALTDIELTYFVAAVSMHGLTFEEITFLTKAMAETGGRFKTKKKPVVDKHCIGGVPGNRTTMIVVPILAAFGLTVPKTSSRAITSPAGTADTMECLTNVSLPLPKMTKVVKKTGACMVWGGAMRLAPADDKIIRIERPMAIDVTGLMLSSVMAKKYSVGATHVVIDIPYGKGAKVEKRYEAEELKQHFLTIGKLLGMKMLVTLTDGKQPIGRGVGPLLEAEDVLKVLRNEPDAPADLREKSILLAGSMLEFLGTVQKGLGRQVAREILTSGDAWKKMQEIIVAQGRKSLPRRTRFTRDVVAHRNGTVNEIKNKAIAKVARLAGAPVTQAAGVYLHKKVGDGVKKGEALFTIHSESKHKLAEVLRYLKTEDAYVVK